MNSPAARCIYVEGADDDTDDYGGGECANTGSKHGAAKMFAFADAVFAAQSTLLGEAVNLTKYEVRHNCAYHPLSCEGVRVYTCERWKPQHYVQ